MSTKLLDSELMTYWSMLNDAEKQSLLTTVKNYIDSKQREELPDDMRKALVMEERNSYLKGHGLSYSWEAVKKMAQGKPRPDGV